MFMNRISFITFILQYPHAEPRHLRQRLKAPFIENVGETEINHLRPNLIGLLGWSPDYHKASNGQK